jgi:tRNA 2-thiouridine synthesizing protein A
MSETIDARGLSCPQPVILTRGKIKELSGGEIIVLVDNETAKENVIRAAEKRGWMCIEIVEENGDYRIRLKK